MDNSKQELISVIIPCFNTGKIILDTLECIKKQTIKNIELIIVDDGSTDETSYYIKEFCKKNEKINIKYYYKTNGGVSSARNFGIKKSEYKYLIFLDSDDQFNSNMFEVLYLKIKNDNSDIAIANALVYKNGKSNVLKMNIDDSRNSNLRLMVSIFGNLVAKKKYKIYYSFGRSVCAKIYKKSIICNNNIEFDNKMFLFEDGFFNLNYLSYSKKISYIQDPLYIYMIEHGKSKKFRKNIIEENRYKIKKLDNFVKNMNSDIKQSVKVYYLDLLSAFIIGFIDNKDNNIKFSQKKILLKNEVKEVYSRNITWDIFKYLNVKKKFVMILLKLHLYSMLILILKQRR